MIPRRFLAILVMACLGGPGAALAAERTHVVRSGESISAIARDYYGDTSLAELLRTCNALPDNVIRAGETLRIPYAEPYLVGSGDTWSGIARRHTGRASAYPALALLNDLPPEAPLAIGARILLPAVVTHTLERGESLVGLADRFYGDGTRADLLALFNGIEDPRRLSIGQTIDVPLVSLLLKDEARRFEGSGTAKAGPRAAPAPPGSSRVDAGKPSKAPPGETGEPAAAAVTPEPSPVDARQTAGPSPAGTGAPEATAVGPAASRNEAGTAAEPSPAKAGESPEARVVLGEPIDGPTGPPPVPPELAPSRYARRIDASLAAYRRGDYERARDLLESLRGPVESDGSEEDRSRLLRGLAFVYVAYDLPAPACEAYRAAPAPPGDPLLDPDEISPKIRRVLAGCAERPASPFSARR